jgi:hypothetical protein
MALNQAQFGRQKRLKNLLLIAVTFLCLTLALVTPATASANSEGNCPTNSPVYRLTFINYDIAYICISPRMRLFIGFMLGQASRTQQ